MNEDTFGTQGQPPLPGQPDNNGSQPVSGQRSDAPAEPTAAGQYSVPASFDDASDAQTPSVRSSDSGSSAAQQAPSQPGYVNQPYHPGPPQAASPQAPAGQRYGVQPTGSWPTVPPPFGVTGPRQPTGTHQAAGPHQPTGGYPAGGTQTLPPYMKPPQKNPRRRGGLLVTAALIAGLVGGSGGAVAVNAIAGGSANTANALTTSNVQAKDQVLNGSVEAVAKKVMPSVVQINVANGQTAGTGSGIILTTDGMIMTNNHVVESAASGGSITVLFSDGTSANATIVGRDPLTDIAVIKVQGKSGLTPATLGKSANVKVGQDVVAVGSPLGLQGTVTSGIVSALNRPVSAGSSESGASNTDVYPAIQTDAPINPGNSGGPLADMNGNIIGVDASIASTNTSSSQQSGSVGLGFAIPMDLASNIASQIMDGNTVVHAKLGASVADSVGADGITAEGAQIKAVTAGSAAAKAGLRSGDVVTSVNGITINNAQGLVAEIRSFSPGQTVSITVQRSGNAMQLKATLDSDGGQPTS
ncbi:putative serine protease PepD [Antricoccus suffuscus]|uniref:Putative serine protease PepD n=1 Tax=Antricoccus suffuscus TaxID=1629062 RepID=A0A2T1A2B0_9ACTN|nr:trypsin-like peptidase domain-containing protein [Antricoccus suffuscus]PRZ42751.1 putative serine protease PepD [Antricoccus suffuscus]